MKLLGAEWVHFKNRETYVTVGISSKLPEDKNLSKKELLFDAKLTEENLRPIKIYSVNTEMYHMDSYEELVVYYNKDNPEKVYGRPTAMFMEKVEHEGREVLRFQPDSELWKAN